METLQLIIIIVSSFIILITILNLCKKFGRKDISYYILLPLTLFIIGFLFRLSKESNMIDVGYFLTELSYILLTTFFVIALLLGQLKYWKK